MKKLYFSLLLAVLGFIGLSQPLAVNASDIDDNELTATELATDDITPADLDIAESEINLPGTFGHWWQNFAIDTQIWLTRDKSKEAKLTLKQANLEILAAKKLAGVRSDQAKTALKKALANYQKHFAGLAERLKNVPEEKRKEILAKMDQQQLKHQELFRGMLEQAPTELQAEIAKIKEQRLRDWYAEHNEKLSERLQKAIEQNDRGSKFKQLQNLITLEEMAEILPAAAKSELDEAAANAASALRDRLSTLKAEDQKKFEVYLDKISIGALTKVEIISRLQTGQANTAWLKQINDDQLTAIKKRWQNLDDNAKEKFLQENFGADASAIKFRLLQMIQEETPALRKQLEEFTEQQQQKLQTIIQNMQSREELEKLRQEMQTIKNPVLKKEIEERARVIENSSTTDLPAKIEPADDPQIRPIYNSGLTE